MNLIGKKAYIKATIDSPHAGGWGVIVDKDADGCYHVAMYGDADDCLVFTRKEFTVHK